jgi:hypothetical protein
MAYLGDRLEHLHQICSDKLKSEWTAAFLVFGFVSAQLQGSSNLLLRQSLAKVRAGLAIKNPRCSSLHLFCQCSSRGSVYSGLDVVSQTVSDIGFQRQNSVLKGQVEPNRTVK